MAEPIIINNALDQSTQLASKGNIVAGKNSYVYDAHTYHTKVPPEGIATLIEYYTQPSEIVLDPFCGSGMTGVAATENGRQAILSDLSPAATFIAKNLNTPVSAEKYWNAVCAILESAKELELNLYGTHCRSCNALRPSLYTVWSFGVLCSHCNKEFILWDVIRDEKPKSKDSKLKKEFDCPHCHKNLLKRTLIRTKRYPVEIGYKCCVKGLTEQKAIPDVYDLEKIKNITQESIPSDLWYPTNSFPDGINTRQPIQAGITSVDKAYSPRALWAMAYLWQKASQWNDEEIRSKLMFTVTSLYQRVTWFSEFRFWGGSSNTANYNVPAIANEQNVFKTFERKAKTILLYFKNAQDIKRNVQVSTRSACNLEHLQDASIDYIFTDPPFGSNINYSEMNFIWESWLGIHTDTKDEAIVNKIQKKGFKEYEILLTKAFLEMNRVLKNNGWLSVVFHNSSAQVWQCLQTAIQNAGFKIEGTQTFDKKHATFKQFVSDNAVGYDLILNCKKSVIKASYSNEVDIIPTVTDFIKKQLVNNPSDYQIKYLHVHRKTEFDYRRLYSEWLAYSLPRIKATIDFEQFRNVVDKLTKKVIALEIPYETTPNTTSIYE